MNITTVFVTLVASSAFNAGVLKAEVGENLLGSKVALNGVRCDATIVLKTGFRKEPLALFVRYWVTPDSIRAEVLWALPHFGAMNFPIYPPTTLLQMHNEGFLISNSFQGVSDLYPLPIADRGVFSCTNNAYPIADTRFVVSEADKWRILQNDFPPGFPDAVEATESTQVNIQDSSRDVRLMDVEMDHTRLDRLTLRGPNGDVRKRIEYRYATDKADAHLEEQHVFLSEHSIIVGGVEANVNINGEMRNYSNVTSLYHQGGREAIVKYRQTRIDSQDVALPNHILVMSGSSPEDRGSTERSELLQAEDVKQPKRPTDPNWRHIALIYNVKPLSESELSYFKSDVNTFSKYSLDERKWRRLRNRYWKKPASAISEKDVVEFERLSRILKLSDGDEPMVARQFRTLHMRLMIALILGENDTVMDLFKNSLELLEEADLGFMSEYYRKTFVKLLDDWQRPELKSMIEEAKIAPNLIH